jgi:hypothetical protein
LDKLNRNQVTYGGSKFRLLKATHFLSCQTLVMVVRERCNVFQVRQTYEILKCDYYLKIHSGVKDIFEFYFSWLGRLVISTFAPFSSKPNARKERKNTYPLLLLLLNQYLF